MVFVACVRPCLRVRLCTRLLACVSECVRFYACGPLCLCVRVWMFACVCGFCVRACACVRVLREHLWVRECVRA